MTDKNTPSEYHKYMKATEAGHARRDKIRNNIAALWALIGICSPIILFIVLQMA